MAVQFRLFVYGTLKRGESNHNYIPLDSVITKASVRGKLFDSENIPVLGVPEENILAFGTRDYKADGLLLNGDYSKESNETGDIIKGELVTFELNEENLIKLMHIDFLEGYMCGNNASLYERAMLWVDTEEGERVTAWAYIL
jgi:gamma-glutamylcyclotransferase (GGCT)/AIG2-like uncharacterized protein YtfP